MAKQKEPWAKQGLGTKAIRRYFPKFHIIRHGGNGFDQPVRCRQAKEVQKGREGGLEYGAP